MTERLYYSDSYRTTFEARIVECLTLNDAPAVVLDRTAFYPTGGGQPHDTGVLGLPPLTENGIPVLDVLVREADQAVVHLLSAARPVAALSPDAQVRGEIDWSRRFDHMQQHTGQHILSQAFVQTVGADTVGFHLSADYSTIDLNRSPLSNADLAHAESLANQIVFEDRPVTAHLTTSEEATQLPLRKPPTAHGSIRVVQIEDFDRSACGGTHVARTGEVGLIKIVRSERRGSETRITFLCGRRALSHYDALNTLTRTLAARLSVGVEELPQAIERLQTESRSVRKERDRLHELLLDHEAVALIAGAQVIGPVSVVHKIFEAREVEEVRRLATRIAAQPGHIAMLGITGEKAQLIFARAADLSYDMRPLLQEACRMVGGGGGGGPELAQGGGPYPVRLNSALQHATDLLRRQIEGGEEG